MAEPYAAMALEEEQKATRTPDPLLTLPDYKPAFQVGSHIDQGKADEAAATEAATAPGLISNLYNYPDTIQRSFRSGGNFAYQIYKQIDRATEAGPEDPDWNNRKQEWLKTNRENIPEDQDWRYMQARNQHEADAMLADATNSLKDQEILARRGGLSTFVAQGLSGIIDVDTIPSLFLGGVTTEAKLGIMSSRMARLGYAGLVGAGTGAAAATAGYYADPNSDWTIIPTVGLAGFAFGAAGGLLGGEARATANATREKAVNEFGETIAEGAPRAKENIHNDVFSSDDSYHSQYYKEMEAAAEADIQAEKEVADVKRAASTPRVSEDGKVTTYRSEGNDTYVTTTRRGADIKVGIASGAKAERGKGIARGIYEDIVAAAAKDGGALVSDFTVSDDAARVYDSLARRGYNVERNPEAFRNETINGRKGWAAPNIPGKDWVYRVTPKAEQAAGEVSPNPRVTGQPEAKRAPTAFSVDDTAQANISDPLDGPEGRSTVGARQLGTSGPGLQSVRSTQSLDIIQSARTWAQQSGVLNDWHDGYANAVAKAGPIGKAAQRFSEFLSATPLATDFSRLMDSGSTVAAKVAYDLFENASGIIRNHRSAARIMEHYQRMIGAPFTGFEDAYNTWAANKGAGFVERHWDTNLRDDFNRQVVREMQSRYYDGTAQATGRIVDPMVNKAADALDNTFAREANILRGRQGEIPVKGAENLQAKSGYMPQKWVGRNMNKLIEQGITRKQIVDAIAEAYVRAHPSIVMKDAQIYADAVVGRAEKFDIGINTNLIGMLQGDGRVELEDILRRNGMPDNEIEKFIDRLTTEAELKGAPGQLKQRLDVDLRYVASNGVNIMDLVDTDFAHFMPNRIRRSGGQAALARQGIDSKVTWNRIVDAILEEQHANGPTAKTGTKPIDKFNDFVDSDRKIDREFLDAMYSYFNGGPIAGGINPVYSRIRKITNLALLNQLGLTQLAELGPNIAAVGLSSFFEHLGDSIRAELKNAKSILTQELEHFNIFVPEERLFRDDRIHEFDRGRSQYELVHNLDRLLNKAQRVQGYTSGFYAMRNIQQRLAMTSGTEKLMQHFKNGGLLSQERLDDMALGDINVLNRMKQYVDNGTVQFNAQGRLVKLNLDNWKPEDVELFSTTMNAVVNQYAQRAMAGESNIFFHKDGMAQLFFHLKSFPLLALEKQVLRNARIMDTESAMQFMYGLATAAVAYAARQTINGRTDQLSMTKIAKGAFGYSNFTGWIPMWTDPLAAMLGMNSLRMGGYTPLYGQNQVVSVPAAYSTLDRIAQIPGALINTVANAGPSSGDINALTAAPLIGNAYGFAAMFNALR